MTSPSAYRDTDRHSFGEACEQAFLDQMEFYGVPVEDHRGDATDTQLRFKVNGIVPLID